MNKINTDDLIQFLYNETSESQNIVIKEALENDLNLREEYEELKNTIDELGTLSYSPNAKTIENILKYA
jgi:hypothetical protein